MVKSRSREDPPVNVTVNQPRHSLLMSLAHAILPYRRRKRFWRRLLPFDWRLYLRGRRAYQKLLRGEVGSECRIREIAFLRNFVSPGAKVIDIGANVGYYTIQLSNIVGVNGNVLAFEPVLPTRKILKMILHRHGAKNVTIYPWALGDRNYSGTMTIPPDDSLLGYRLGRACIVDKADAIGTGREPCLQYEVEIRRLDDLDIDTDRASFVKIDVEGVELQVLRGMTGVLRQDKPTILAEVRDYHVGDVMVFMREIGYSAFVLHDDFLYPEESDAAADYFFIHFSKLSNFEHLIHE